MNETNGLEDQDPLVLESVPSEMRNRFQDLYQLYAHAEELTQALERRLKQPNHPQPLKLPSREL